MEIIAPLINSSSERLSLTCMVLNAKLSYVFTNHSLPLIMKYPGISFLSSYFKFSLFSSIPTGIGIFAMSTSRYIKFFLFMLLLSFYSSVITNSIWIFAYTSIAYVVLLTLQKYGVKFLICLLTKCYCYL